MRIKAINVFTALFLIVLSANQIYAADEQIRFGVYPHLPSRDLEKVYAPIAEEFSKVLNKPVSFESSSSFENFNDRLDQDTFDIVFVQPFDYVRIADAYGYRPLAMRGEPLYTVFAVKEDSDINNVNDLKGKKLALPPSIAAVSRLAHIHIEKHGISPVGNITLIHRRSHMSCLQQVLINQADACATASPVLRFFENKMKVKFRKVGQTQSIPHTLFAVHPRVSEKEKEKLRDLILSWGNTKEGQDILRRGRLMPFHAVNDPEYDIVRQLLKK